MKNTALTIGLFSLVMVLTSFTSPETTTNSNATIDLGINGGSTGGGRKLDVYDGAATSKTDVYATVQGGDNTGGSTGGGRKID